MLVLHIGSGKCGSTTIQNWLKQNRVSGVYRQLESLGGDNAWKLSLISGTARSHNYWVKHLKVLDDAELLNFQKTFWLSVEQEYLSSDNKQIVASSEYIFNQYDDGYDSILSLKENLTRIFGQVKIILYLRNQVDFIKSYYSQAVKGSSRITETYKQYVRDIAVNRLPINYEEKVSLWARAFGKDNISPVVFDKNNFQNGNLIEDFCYRANINIDSTYQTDSYNQRSNITPSISQIEALRVLNRFPNLTGKSRYAVSNIIKYFFSNKEFTSASDNQIISLVSEGNQKLNHNYFSTANVKLPVSDHYANES